MRQEILETVQEPVSKKKALGVTLDTGIYGGLAIGVILGSALFFNYSLHKGIDVDNAPAGYTYMFHVVFLTASSWGLMTLVCGVIAGKRTGRGAKMGAYCGLFLGPISVVSTVGSILIWQFIFFPSTFPTNPLASPSSSDALEFLLEVIACVALVSSGIGSLIAAVGASIPLGARPLPIRNVGQGESSGAQVSGNDVEQR
jgi:hypothetical protein